MTAVLLVRSLVQCWYVAWNSSKLLIMLYYCMAVMYLFPKALQVQAAITDSTIWTRLSTISVNLFRNFNIPKAAIISFYKLFSRQKISNIYFSELVFIQVTEKIRVANLWQDNPWLSLHSSAFCCFCITDVRDSIMSWKTLLLTIQSSTWIYSANSERARHQKCG